MGSTSSTGGSHGYVALFCANPLLPNECVNGRSMTRKAKGPNGTSCQPARALGRLSPFRGRPIATGGWATALESG